MSGVAGRRRWPRRDRDHQRPARNRRLKLRYSEQEYAAVQQAAVRAGLTPSGYAAEVALAAATSTSPPEPTPWREALLEVIAARTQVRRYAVNVNQAVAVLHSTGALPEWFAATVAGTDRAVTRLDAAAVELARRLR